MTFDEFISAGWKDHVADAAGVASRLAEGSRLVEKNEQIPALANLIARFQE